MRRESPATRKLLLAVWFLGLMLSASWVGFELYRVAWRKDWSIQNVTLLLFWLFAGRKAGQYLRRERRSRVD